MKAIAMVLMVTMLTGCSAARLAKATRRMCEKQCSDAGLTFKGMSGAGKHSTCVCEVGQ